MPALLLAALTAATLAQGVALPRDVPYLPQTEALCGGAAAAMVMRYWGASARPEDFAALIDERQQGIVTTALVADLRARGWQAFPLRGAAGDTALLRQHLGRGRPIIALIEDRPSRFHYVVVTAADDRAVRFHDPAKAPSQAMDAREFDRRWQAAAFWMLLLLPSGEPAATAPAAPEPELARDVAALLAAGNTSEALRVSTAATRANPADLVAWDALATSLFVLDREEEALGAWNRAARPDIDIVQVAGLVHTRFRPAERLIGLTSGERLTPSRLGRARQRLAMLPSALTARVGYAPATDGRVVIDAAIVERSRIPSFFELAIAAAKAPFSREVEIGIANITGSGERVTGSWRFRPGFERVEAAIETPAPLAPGAVWRISGHDSRETYDIHTRRTTQRWRRAAFQAADWMTPSLGWVAAAGYERWPAIDGDTRQHKTYVGGRAMVAGGSAFDAHVTLEGWIGGAGATRASALARLRRSIAGGLVSLAAGTEGVHGNTPAFVMPGAGDGNTRRPLLRAHPLIADDAITVDGGQLLGRRLVFGTIEWTTPIVRLGLASIDAAVFTDAAYAWQLLDGRLRDHQIDAGAGLRVRALAGPTFRIDIARGLLDGRWALTAGTTVAIERWLF
ncbi:MAG: C39 family peptidase [Acidobacteriota bacterium]|nr:C39 family peptidase [Acidobacteriota bacterium]